MILFIILILIIVLALIFGVAILSVSGAAFILVFGDLIVCIALIWFIIKLCRRKKKKRR